MRPLSGNAGDTHSNTVSVTAVDNEANSATDDAAETVTFTNVDPTIVVTKTAAPGVGAGGGRSRRVHGPGREHITRTKR